MTKTCLNTKILLCEIIRALVLHIKVMKLHK